MCCVAVYPQLFLDHLAWADSPFFGISWQVSARRKLFGGRALLLDRFNPCSEADDGIGILAKPVCGVTGCKRGCERRGRNVHELTSVQFSADSAKFQGHVFC